MTRQFHDNWLRIDLEISENHSPGCDPSSFATSVHRLANMSYMPKYRIYNTYLRKKEGVSIYANYERDFLLSARRSCLVIVD